MTEQLRNLSEVDPLIIAYLAKVKLELSHLWLLLRLKVAEEAGVGDITDYPEVVRTTLIRKGYMTEANNITGLGDELIKMATDPQSITADELKVKVKRKRDSYSTQFTEWWDTYPVGSYWKDEDKYGGRIWSGDRTFRTKKEDCQVKYLEALATPGITHQDMLNALKFEVELKKGESRRTGENKMAYFINTHTYLLNKIYENYIEMAKATGYGTNKQPAQTSFKTTLV